VKSKLHTLVMLEYWLWWREIECWKSEVIVFDIRAIRF